MTGQPLVDANMRQLKATGFMSSEGRQLVASFLTHNLDVDWRLGAAYFEEVLIDYEVTSNWGNWVFQAGLCGGDRTAKKLNVLQMSQQHDRDGDFCKLWCPELAHLPASKIFMPWMLSKHEQDKFKLSIVPYAGIRASSDLPCQPDSKPRLYTYPRPLIEIAGARKRET